jgi:hypothetical protein
VAVRGQHQRRQGRVHQRAQPGRRGEARRLTHGWRAGWQIKSEVVHVSQVLGMHVCVWRGAMWGCDEHATGMWIGIRMNDSGSFSASMSALQKCSDTLPLRCALSCCH